MNDIEKEKFKKWLEKQDFFHSFVKNHEELVSWISTGNGALLQQHSNKYISIRSVSKYPNKKRDYQVHQTNENYDMWHNKFISESRDKKLDNIINE